MSDIKKTPPPRDDEAGKAEDNSPPIVQKVRSGVLVGILALMILYTAYFAREILIPMALAFLFSLILTPLVGWLARLRIPRPAGAALVLALLLAGFGFGIYGLSGPATHWIGEAPQALQKLERTFHFSNGGPLDEVQKAKKQAENTASKNQGNKKQATPVKIVNRNSSMMSRAASVTPVVLTGIGIAVVLLYFLLAASDSFLRSLAHAVPRWPDKRRVVEVARSIQHNIARYLFTITLINLSVGLVDGFILWLIGIPDFVLWGAMIALFNYVPYLGALVSIVIVFLISLMTFHGIGVIIAAPATMMLISILEGQFITPHVVGRRLALSPVAVFVTLVVWGWLWGIVGAIIAVPMLAAFNIMCEEIKPLNPISDFLTSYYAGND